jgi:hypothetical protein
MLPESKWNSPYTAIEDTRKEIQFQKFLNMSELWNAPFPVDISKEKSRDWNFIFVFQSETLKKAVALSSSANSYFNQLQNACWQYGKTLAEKDWPESNIDHPVDGFLALSTLKLGQLKNSEPFILERKTEKSCSFYWLSSPIDHEELCMLYHEVFRGYCYHLSRNLRMEVHATILPSSEEKVKAWKINLLWID